MRYSVKQVIVTDASTPMNLNLGFVPDKVHVKNIKQWDQSSKKVEFFWNKNLFASDGTTDISDGGYKGMENLATVATNGRKPIESASNGFSIYNTTSMANRRVLIDAAAGVTQASNAVVETATPHGLQTGDKVTFHSIVKGMRELNGLSTRITRLSSTEFSCDYINSTQFTAWDTGEAGGMIIKTSHVTEDVGFQGITLGTHILGANGDILEITASYSGNYELITQ